VSRQLIYLVYGPDIAYHTEARFSILSALYRSGQQNNQDREKINILVYTDRPEFYRSLPVQAQPLTKTALEQWAGPHAYNHRAKLCLLQKVVPQAEQTVFIDTDTFFLQAPEQLFACFDEQTCLVDELRWDQLPETIAKDNQVAQLLAKHGINPARIPLINSGLFGIARKHHAVLDLALELCDAMYLPSGRFFAIEQLALGLAASTRVVPKQDPELIKHYWSRKNLFRAKVQAFVDQYLDSWDSREARRAFLLVTPEIPKPPRLVRLPLRFLSRFICQRERQLFMELFFGSYAYSNPFDRACQTAWLEKAVDNYLNKTNADGKHRCQLHNSTLARRLLSPQAQQFIRDKILVQSRPLESSR
jgi:hypothetical protein